MSPTAHTVVQLFRRSNAVANRAIDESCHYGVRTLVAPLRAAGALSPAGLTRPVFLTYSRRVMSWLTPRDVVVKIHGANRAGVQAGPARQSR